MKRTVLFTAFIVTASTLTSIFATTAHAAPPKETRETIVCRGLSGVGFVYDFGGECWCADGCKPDLTTCPPGACKDNHKTGKYGADCSGFVSKAWQVPDPYPVEKCNVPRFGAAVFAENGEHWKTVSKDSLLPGDAASKVSHVVLIAGEKDSKGSYDIVHASSCNVGIVHKRFSLKDEYVGARRNNLMECECEPGASETNSCGDCGKTTRQCNTDCTWGKWSLCEGPDPTSDTACTVDGGKGVCAVGVKKCEAGHLTCIATTPTEETCDGVDNDCDGVVDNGTPNSLGEGVACVSPCGSAKTVCAEGLLRCVPDGKTWPDIECDSPDRDAATPDSTSDVKDSSSRPDIKDSSSRSDFWDDNESSDGGCSCVLANSASQRTASRISIGAWLLFAAAAVIARKKRNTR